MQGKAGAHAHAHDQRGFTPACAGKRVGVSHPDRFIEDHPRMCGEKLDALQEQVDNKRITPAYAGKR